MNAGVNLIYYDCENKQIIRARPDTFSDSLKMKEIKVYRSVQYSLSVRSVHYSV